MQWLNPARFSLRPGARLYLLTTLALLLVLAAPVSAQESASSDAGESTAQSGEASAKPSKTTKKAAGTKSEKPADTAKKSERFDPSEEISKDLSVSFPVDI